MRQGETMGRPTRRPWAAVLAAVALTAGCAHKPSVVGAWSGAVASPQGMTAKTTIVFMADGKETMAVNIAGGRAPLALASTGTYTVTDTSLTQTFDTISVRGVSHPFPPGRPNSETDQFKLAGDTLTLTKPGSPVPLVLTRDKTQ